MKLPFTPTINKINGNYYVIPAKSGTPYRTLIKCDERTAKLINLLGSNISEARMLEQAKEILKGITLADIVSAVRHVRGVIKAHEFKEGIFEVLEV